MKKIQAVRHYYILPCCLLLLNLVNSLVSYKAGVIGQPLLRTAVVIVLVLFGSSLTAFVAAPAIERVVKTLHQRSRKGAGQVGETVFLVILGAVIFWLYYQIATRGPEAILPRSWWNSAL